MQSQVQESIEVWRNIQASAALRKGSPSSFEVETEEDVIDEEEAKDLATRFVRIRDSCRQSASRVDSCDSESECSKASMDLTICMGKILCPLQQQTLAEALTSSDNSDAAETKIDAAISNLSECVAMKNNRKARAQEVYPELFEEPRKSYWRFWS